MKNDDIFLEISFFEGQWRRPFVHSLWTACPSRLWLPSIQGQCGALLQSDGMATAPTVSPDL